MNPVTAAENGLKVVAKAGKVLDDAAGAGAKAAAHAEAPAATTATTHAELADEATDTLTKQADTVGDEATEAIVHKFKKPGIFSIFSSRLNKTLKTVGDITPETIAKVSKEDGDNVILELTNKAKLTFSKVDDQLKMAVDYPEGAGLDNVSDITIKNETKLPQAVQDTLTEQGLLNKVDNAVEETVENTAEAGAKQLDDGADNATSQTDDVIETDQAVVKVDEPNTDTAKVGEDIADTAEEGVEHEAKRIVMEPKDKTITAAA